MYDLGHTLNFCTICKIGCSYSQLFYHRYPQSNFGSQMGAWKGATGTTGDEVHLVLIGHHYHHHKSIKVSLVQAIWPTPLDLLHLWELEPQICWMIQQHRNYLKSLFFLNKANVCHYILRWGYHCVGSYRGFHCEHIVAISVALKKKKNL